jgi:hypothetical protein
MDASTILTGDEMTYSLWHIPSSTLLVNTCAKCEVERKVQCALDAGCRMEDLMLQVKGRDELLGHQHLGPCIVEALSETRDAEPVG